MNKRHCDTCQNFIRKGIWGHGICESTGTIHYEDMVECKDYDRGNVPRHPDNNKRE